MLWIRDDDGAASGWVPSGIIRDPRIGRESVMIVSCFPQEWELLNTSAGPLAIRFVSGFFALRGDAEHGLAETKDEQSKALLHEGHSGRNPGCSGLGTPRLRFRLGAASWRVPRG